MKRNFVEVGEVQAIFLSDFQDGPMRAFQEVQAIERLGLVAVGGFPARSAIGQGVHAYGSQPRALQVSLITAEMIALANEGLELPFTPQETRRNIVTEGVDLNELLGLPFYVGDVSMHGIEPCEPYRRPGVPLEKGGFAPAFEGLGGLLAAVTTRGSIQIGDAISIHERVADRLIPIPPRQDL